MKQKMLTRNICKGILNYVFLKLYEEVWDTSVKPAAIFWGSENIGQNQHTGTKCWQLWKENEESSDYDLRWGKKITLWDFSLQESPAYSAMLCTVKNTDYWSEFGSKVWATNDLIYLNLYNLSEFGRGYMQIGNKGVTKAWILKS